MVALDLSRALLTAAPLALALAGALQPWHLYAVLILISILGTAYGPATYATLPRLVELGRLLRANAWLSGGLEAMYLAGPAAGGLFIARFGPPQAMAVDAVSFLVSAALIFALPAAAGRPSAEARREPYRGALAVGWRLLRDDATLWALTAMNAIQGATDMVFGVLMVPFVRSVLHGGPVDVGLFEASLSAGVILAALIAPHRGWDRHPLAVWLCVVAFCLATGALAVARTVAVAIALQAAAGIAAGLFDIRATTLFQSTVANDRLGRTFALRDAARSATQSGSALLAGVLPLLVGVAGVFGVFGLVGAGLGAAVTFAARRGGTLTRAT
jgi:hypothetical protein